MTPRPTKIAETPLAAAVHRQAATVKTMNDKSKTRRNVLLFWAHIVLTLVILGGFVYSVMHK